MDNKSAHLLHKEARTMELSKKTSWTVRKIIIMRKNWQTHGQSSNFIQKGDFTCPVHTSYWGVKYPNVPWRKLICQNVADPKHVFLLWLCQHGKLRTKDLLLSWPVWMWMRCVYSVILNLRSRTTSFLNSHVHIAFGDVYYSGKSGKEAYKTGTQLKWIQQKTRDNHSRGTWRPVLQ